MKKLHTLFFIITFFIAGIAGAQIKKGAIFLGGDIGGNTGKTKSNGAKILTSTTLNISPVIGKAIKENIIFGVNASFGFSKTTAQSSATFQKQIYTGAGVFLRKYKTIGHSGFAAFLQGDFGGSYAWQNYESNNPSSSDSKRYTIGLSAYPGLSYAISRKLQLETGFTNLLSLGFYTETSLNHANGFPPYVNKTNGWSLNTNLNNFGSSLYLGFRVLLNKS